MCKFLEIAQMPNINKRKKERKKEREEYTRGWTTFEVGLGAS